MNKSFLLPLAALALATVSMGCKPESTAADDVDPTAMAKRGRRDEVVTKSAAPLCASETQSYLAGKATEWWSGKVDPTGRNDGPYSYLGAKAEGAPIAEVVAQLRGRGVDLADDPRAHRWEAGEGRVKLMLEGQAKGQPGFLATFELVPKDGALVVDHLSILRGQTRWECGPDGNVVPAS